MLNVILRHMVCLAFTAILRSSHRTYVQPPTFVCSYFSFHVFSWWWQLQHKLKHVWECFQLLLWNFFGIEAPRVLWKNTRVVVNKGCGCCNGTNHGVKVSVTSDKQTIKYSYEHLHWCSNVKVRSFRRVIVLAMWLNLKHNLSSASDR